MTVYLPNKQQLLPCPYCGETTRFEVGVEKGEERGTYYAWVLCLGCAAHGPAIHNADPALISSFAEHAWNARVPIRGLS